MNEENFLQGLQPDAYAIAKPFFTDFTINEPLLHSILENKSAGTVFTDDKKNPSFVLVHNPASYTFLGGDPDLDSLRKIASYLKTLPQVSLVSPQNWKFRAFFEKEGFMPIERLQFRRPSNILQIGDWEKNLSREYSVARINVENFSACNWYSFILCFYGNSDQFFRNAVGFCLADQNKIMSESYGVIANKKIELGVITEEKYRGQNLGTMICAIMLGYSNERDLEAYWSCDGENLASIAIAKKLGFEEDCHYVFLKWTRMVSV